MQQRPQDAAHVRIVVADEKAQLVEVDAKHDAQAKGSTFINHIAPRVNEALRSGARPVPGKGAQ
jgi:hypothetical protein